MQQQKRKPQRTSQGSWVPSGVKATRSKAPARKRTANSDDASQWLPAEVKRPARRNGRSDGNGAGNGHAGAEPDTPRSAPRRHKLPKRATARERWFLLRLRRSQRRVGDRDEEIERLRDRVAELEQELAARKRLRRPRPASKPRRDNGRLDLNGASFEELRTIGLSVTQSSRLIAHRDMNGDFSSFGEIEELPGFGKATLQLLRSKARTNGSS